MRIGMERDRETTCVCVSVCVSKWMPISICGKYVAIMI